MSKKSDSLIEYQVAVDIKSSVETVWSLLTNAEDYIRNKNLIHNLRLVYSFPFTKVKNV